MTVFAGDVDDAVEAERMARKAAEERADDAGRALDAVQLESDRLRDELARQRRIMEDGIALQFNANVSLLAPTFSNVLAALKRWLRSLAPRR